MHARSMKGLTTIRNPRVVQILRRISWEMKKPRCLFLIDQSSYVKNNVVLSCSSLKSAVFDVTSQFHVSGLSPLYSDVRTSATRRDDARSQKLRQTIFSVRFYLFSSRLTLSCGSRFEILINFTGWLVCLRMEPESTNGRLME